MISEVFLPWREVYQVASFHFAKAQMTLSVNSMALSVIPFLARASTDPDSAVELEESESSDSELSELMEHRLSTGDLDRERHGCIVAGCANYKDQMPTILPGVFSKMMPYHIAWFTPGRGSLLVHKGPRKGRSLLRLQLHAPLQPISLAAGEHICLPDISKRRSLAKHLDQTCSTNINKPNDTMFTSKWLLARVQH